MIPRGWRVAHHITPDPPRQSLFQETSFAPERPDNPQDLNEDSVVLLPDGVLLLLGGHTRIEEGNRGVMSRTARILTDGLLWALGESKEGRPKQITDIAIIQDGLERLLSVHGLEQEYNQFAGINDEIA